MNSLIWRYIALLAMATLLPAIGHSQRRGMADFAIANHSFEEGWSHWHPSFEGVDMDTVMYQERNYVIDENGRPVEVFDTVTVEYYRRISKIEPFASSSHGTQQALHLLNRGSEPIIVSQSISSPAQIDKYYGLSLSIKPVKIQSLGRIELDRGLNIKVWLGTKASPYSFPLYDIQRLNESLDSEWESIQNYDIAPNQAYDLLTIELVSGDVYIDALWPYPKACIGDPSFEALGSGKPFSSDWQIEGGSAVTSYGALMPTDGQYMAKLSSHHRNYCVANQGFVSIDNCEIREDISEGMLSLPMPLPDDRNYGISFDWALASKAGNGEAYLKVAFNGGAGINYIYSQRVDLSSEGVWNEARIYTGIPINVDYNRVTIYLAMMPSAAYPNCLINCEGSEEAVASILIDNISVAGTPSVSFEESVPCFPKAVSFLASGDMLGRSGGCIRMLEWDFGGSGASSREYGCVADFEEAASFAFPAPGKYNVSVTATSSCLTKARYTKEILVGGFEEVAHQWSQSWHEMQEVLAVSSATFSQARLTDLSGHGRQLDQMSPYENGQLGQWKPDASYAYVEERSGWESDDPHAEVDVRKGGTFPYKTFNADNAPMAMVDGWKKVADITHYNALGAEVENRDILGIHSAALFDEGGQLSTAVGANAKYYELGFSSFETYEDGLSGGTNIGHTGNLNILSDSAVRMNYLPMRAGNSNVITIEWPYSRIGELLGKKFTIAGRTAIGAQQGHEFVIKDAMIDECHSPHPSDAGLSIVSMQGTGFLGIGIWLGQIGWYETASVGYAPRWYSISQTKAHTGLASLRVEKQGIRPDSLISRTGAQSPPMLTQQTLRLMPGKKYVVSAWAASGTRTDAAVSRDTIVAQGLGLRVQIGRQSVLMKPSGAIIEGWQRIEGIFEMPKEEARIGLAFELGADSVAYFDDIRVFPFEGNMVSYVYEQNTYRLQATLDNNNFATLYYYDREGNLRITKKETIEGIKTIQEVGSNSPSTKKP